MKRLKVIERFKRLKPIKHCCRNCHFLAKYTSAYVVQPWMKKIAYSVSQKVTETTNT